MYLLVGLRALACWDCGFESRWKHGYLLIVDDVLSGRGIRGGLIIRAEESCCVWSV